MESTNYDLDRILTEKLKWAEDELKISIKQGGIHIKKDSLRIKIIKQMIEMNDLIKDIYT